MENFDEKKKLSWFSMKAVAFHFDENLKKKSHLLMEKFDGNKTKKLSWFSMKAVAFH